jgi:uncharacterized repeat protein (TIGR03803 family)
MRLQSGQIGGRRNDGVALPGLLAPAGDGKAISHGNSHTPSQLLGSLVHRSRGSACVSCLAVREPPRLRRTRSCTAISAPPARRRSSTKSNGGLILASDGDFYGTTFGRRRERRRNRISYGLPQATSRHPQLRLCRWSNPIAGVIQASDGKLYGTTSRGGANNLGTVFKVDLSATPPGFTASPLRMDRTPARDCCRPRMATFYGTTLSEESTPRERSSA